MGNQNLKEPLQPLDDVPKPAKTMPELPQINMNEHSFSSMHSAPSFSMLANATQFGAFSFPELPTLDLQSALPSISVPDLSKPLLPNVSLPSMLSVGSFHSFYIRCSLASSSRRRKRSATISASSSKLALAPP
jgi:hypothetical protein